MPTYYATEVTASLGICDLQDTLSSDIFRFTGGSQAQADAARVQRVFSFADRLYEKPIGASGVMQFIAIHEDMPLYMVEARKEQAKELDQDSDADAGSEDGIHQSSKDALNQSAFYSDDSSLTSLGPTPTPTQQSFSDSPLKLPHPAQPTAEALASLTDSPVLQDKVQAARDWLNAASTKALVLDINVSDKSFLPTEKAPKNRSLSFKDLKVEVFLNGQLSEATIIHGEMRRTTQHAPKGTVRISGTRIHRQIEKAWIYSQETSHFNSSFDDGDAEHRWNAVSLSHVVEADLRGRDRWGDQPPSADFLKALAGLKLPHEMEAHQGLGIIDIVITAGKGRKYGPETSYLMKPTRLDDARYSSRRPLDSQTVETVLLFPQLHDKNPKETRLEKTKPEETRSEATKAGETKTEDTLTNPTPYQPDISSSVQNAASLTPKQVVDLTKDFDPNIDLDKTIVDTYMGSRGKLVKGRTLRQKLGDVKKMKPTNVERELARLKERYGSEEPTKKKQKMNADLSGDTDVFLSHAAPQIRGAANTADGSETDGSLSHGADSEAAIFQNHVDMALDGDAKGSTASTSPQKTPNRRTKASALASSPTHTPVKLRPPPRMAAFSSKTDPGNRPSDPGCPPSVPKQKASASSAEIDQLRTVRQPKETKTSSSSTRKSAEQSVTETMEAFEIPDCCKGSCVSFDEDIGAARLTGKARGGAFREESVLVGMRFVVI